MHELPDSLLIQPLPACTPKAFGAPVVGIVLALASPWKSFGPASDKRRVSGSILDHLSFALVLPGDSQRLFLSRKDRFGFSVKVLQTILT